jgi:hypothetical protein
MDVSASVRSYPLQDDMVMQGHLYYVLEKLSCNIIIRMHNCCIRYSFEVFIVVNFNVSSIKVTHMLDFLDTSSMGVTFGIRAG